MDIFLVETVKDLFTMQFFHQNLSGEETQKGHKTRHSTDTRLDTNAPSSSSSLEIFNKTTTTKEEGGGDPITEIKKSYPQIDPSWDNVQIPEALRQLNFGSGIIKQVQQLASITSEELQQSLDAFAFDITENNILKNKQIKRPTAYFMAILRKGHSYQPAENFQSDEDKAIEDQIKKREERARGLKERERRFFEAEFEIWLDELPESDKRNPRFMIMGSKYMGGLHRANLKEHFTKSVWPEIWINLQRNLKNLTNFGTNQGEMGDELN
ncbi:MAG: hypothetical protein HQK53_16995 [Oligoflexia bacterium]|nr:hypothetical protein [Oligoflexia bacterium]